MAFAASGTAKDAIKEQHEGNAALFDAYHDPENAPYKNLLGVFLCLDKKAGLVINEAVIARIKVAMSQSHSAREFINTFIPEHMEGNPGLKTLSQD